MKLYKIFEYGYLVIALFFIVSGIMKFSTDSKKAMLFLFFGVIAIFMFFFKRWFRKNRFENRN
jgi:hypothetical protein